MINLHGFSEDFSSDAHIIFSFHYPIPYGTVPSRPTKEMRNISFFGQDTRERRRAFYFLHFFPITVADLILRSLSSYNYPLLINEKVLQGGPLLTRASNLMRHRLAQWLNNLRTVQYVLQDITQRNDSNFIFVLYAL